MIEPETGPEIRPKPFVPRVGDRVMWPIEGGGCVESEVLGVRKTIRSWGGDSMFVTVDPESGTVRIWHDANDLDYIPREADHD
jgi:hypothetical protein